MLSIAILIHQLHIEVVYELVFYKAQYREPLQNQNMYNMLSTLLP